MHLTGSRSMWVLAMFDLPTDSREDRRAYTRFRKALIEDGFSMMQYSVYARHCASRENANVHSERVRSCLPPDGEVRVITVTDKQVERMQIFWGKTRRPPMPAPCQLEFF